MSRLVDDTAVNEAVFFVNFVYDARLVVSVRLIKHLLLQGGPLAKICLPRLFGYMGLRGLVRINHAVNSVLRLFAANVKELFVRCRYEFLVWLFGIEGVPIEHGHIFDNLCLIPLLFLTGSLGHSVKADAFTVLETLSSLFVYSLKCVRK